MGAGADLQVDVVAAAERAVTLDLLFARHPPSERRQAVAAVLGAVARGELSLDGLLLATRDGLPAGAVLSVAQPDGAVVLWPPVVAERFQREAASPADAAACDDVADVLLDAVWRRALAAGMLMLQVLVDPEAVDDERRLLRNGFERLADLQFLERRLDRPLPPQDGTLTPVAFDLDANADRFARVLEETYVGTLDCPRLIGSRSGVEALRSHRLSGNFHPAGWKLFQAGGRDVGVLLLNDHPDRNACEVVYVGVVPAARGRGYGRAMVLDGLFAARDCGRGAVTLAVDAANLPACAIYRELGFEPTTMQTAFIRVCPTRCAAE